MTTSVFDKEDEEFIVLINHEEQYSIWPAWKKIPGGWKAAEGEGARGNKQTVLQYVKENWLDMRPKTLRTWMEEQEAKKQVKH